MSYRFITKSIHAYLIDYPVAIVLIAAPFVLKLGQSGPVAMWLSVVVGVAALLLPALTDNPTGLVRIIPYWLHLWVDRAVGVVFVIAPFAFKFAGLDAWYYWVFAAAVLLTTSVLNAPEEPVATRSGLDRRNPLRWVSIEPLQIVLRMPDQDTKLFQRVDFRARTVGERLEDLFLDALLCQAGDGSVAMFPSDQVHSASIALFASTPQGSKSVTSKI